jgi:hypothetical protein
LHLETTFPPAPAGKHPQPLALVGAWRLALGTTPCARGRQKKPTEPPVHLLNPRPTHPPPSRLFFLGFFLVRFWAFLGEEISKTPLKYFLQKVDKNFDVSFSSAFFVLSRFRVFLNDGSSKALQKNVL